MAEAPIWPVATDAIIADTTDLTDSETCAYIMLMICQWRLNGEGLPNNQGKLQRMSRVDKRKWKQTWENIEHLFELKNNRYYQSRVHKDYIRVLEKILANRKNAVLGGKAKSLKTKELRLAHAKETLSREATNRGGETLPINEPLTIKKKKKVFKEKELAEEFDIFYQAYPRHYGPKDAMKAFLQARKETSLEAILKGVEAYKANKPEWQHWKTPGPWLRAGNWMNEYDDNGKGPELEKWEHIIGEFIKDPKTWNGHFGARPGTPEFFREQPKEVVEIYNRRSVG